MLFPFSVINGFEEIRSKIFFGTFQQLNQPEKKDNISWEESDFEINSTGYEKFKTEDDNPVNDRRSAIWSFIPIFSEEANRWYGYSCLYCSRGN